MSINNEEILEKILAIIDRIAKGSHTENDIITLRESVIISGDGNTVQVGNGNISIAQGRDIHIGDRVYQGASAEEIKKVLREIVNEEPEPIPIDWRKECQKALEQENKLTTNPLTRDRRNLDDVYVSLDLIKTPKQSQQKEQNSQENE